MLSTFSRQALALCALVVSLAASPVLAQNYGPNPGTPGFVPFADGPIPEGTAGVDADGNADFADTSFDFGNDTQLSIAPGQISLTITNNTSGIGGLYDLFAALGNLDLVYETMAGVEVHVTSFVTAADVVIDLRFGDLFTDNSMPVYDGMSSSPGNPLAD